MLATEDPVIPWGREHVGKLVMSKIKHAGASGWKLEMYDEVIKFWFKEIDPEMWWSAEPGVDELIRIRFLTLLQCASQGKLYSWRSNPKGRLAEVIVLGQFSRNIFRNTPQAFAQEAVAINAHKPLSSIECSFLLMPYMHSESRQIHIQAETLYRELTPHKNYTFELRHKAIIDRFGRYPHRNKILGRASTVEEIAFLAQSGSSF